jgi:hypothetical protein
MQLPDYKTWRPTQIEQTMAKPRYGGVALLPEGLSLSYLQLADYGDCRKRQ